MSTKIQNSILSILEEQVPVTRKNMKKMYLRVSATDGSLRVSAPLGTSDGAIRRFVESREDWIAKCRETLAKEQRESTWRGQTPLTEDSRLTLWGKPFDFAPNEKDQEKRQKDLEALYKKELKAAIKELQEPLEERVGKEATSWTLRKMKSRWGSCTVKTGDIRINLWLATKDKKYLEYVMVHELVHLYEANHGPAFYAHMDKYLPGWKELRRELNG